jgi:SAM-dependent methyltransferase
MDIERDWLNLDKDDFLNKWYKDYYSKTSYGKYSGRAHSYLHKSIEKGYADSDEMEKILELGGNLGEHVPFVKHKFERYVLLDKIDNLNADIRADLKLKNVDFIMADAESLPFKDDSFDRVFCTCLLHHVQQPEIVLAEIRRVLKNGGKAEIFLSSDPGLLFRAGRSLTSKRNSSNLGIKKIKELVDARDHINHAGGLEILINHVFRKDAITKISYPFRRLSWNFSFWSVFHIEKLTSNSGDE